MGLRARLTLYAIRSPADLGDFAPRKDFPQSRTPRSRFKNFTGRKRFERISYHQVTKTPRKAKAIEQAVAEATEPQLGVFSVYSVSSCLDLDSQLFLPRLVPWRQNLTMGACSRSVFNSSDWRNSDPPRNSGTKKSSRRANFLCAAFARRCFVQ